MDDPLVERLPGQFALDRDGGDQAQFVDVRGDTRRRLELLDDGIDQGQIERAAQRNVVAREEGRRLDDDRLTPAVCMADLGDQFVGATHVFRLEARLRGDGVLVDDRQFRGERTEHGLRPVVRTGLEEPASRLGSVAESALDVVGNGAVGQLGRALSAHDDRHDDGDGASPRSVSPVAGHPTVRRSSGDRGPCHRDLAAGDRSATPAPASGGTGRHVALFGRTGLASERADRRRTRGPAAAGAAVACSVRRCHPAGS